MTILRTLDFLLFPENIPEPITVEEPKIQTVDAKVDYFSVENPKIVRPTIDYELGLNAVKNAVPVGEDVVDWMREAALLKSLLNYTIESYNSLGGRIAGDSGDAYVPGVSVSSWSFVPVPAGQLHGNVRVYNSETGNVYSVPTYSRRWVGNRNVLVAHLRNGTRQWIAKLLVYLRYAKLPVVSDNQYPLTTFEIQGRGYYSVPFVAEYSSFVFGPTVFRLKLKTYNAVKPYLIVTNPGRTDLKKLELPELEGGKTYVLNVVSREVPKRGYVEVYADGVSRGPVIVEMYTPRSVVGV